MKATIAALLVTISLSSCDLRSTGPDFSQGDFSVDARANSLNLANNSAATVHYLALEWETATRVNLAFDPEQWPSLAPGSEQEIPYADLMGYGPRAQQAIIYWWANGEFGEPILVELR